MTTHTPILKFLAWLIISLFSFGSLAQNYNRPVPENVFPYEYQEFGSLDQGYFLATHTKLQSSSNDPDYVAPYVGIYDHDGYLVWYYSPGSPVAIDFKYYPEFGGYSYTTAQQGSQRTVILDANFNSIDTVSPQNNLQDIHDALLLSNGNWLISTATYDTMDLSAYTFDGTQGSAQTNVRGYGYEEFDPTGNLVNEWNSNDFLSTTETYDFWGYNANSFDYCHGNAYEEDDDGNLLVSYRHLNSIHKLDRQTGAVIWRLGGELSDFTFTNDAGFSGQHDIRRLSNGYYSLFDNGNMTGVTRGVVYDLDTNTWTATKISEYEHPQNYSADAMGSYRILDNGTAIIGYGRIFRPAPSATVLDVSDNILSEFYLQDSVVAYRFLLEDISLPVQPEIVCEFNGAYMELSVTTTHNTYAWSTGETTPTIELTQPGTYQVWVDQGVGMIGSVAFEVSDLSNPPCITGLEELTANDGNFKWLNLLGQEVEKPIKGQLYIKFYSSGKTEKVIFQ